MTTDAQSNSLPMKKYNARIGIKKVKAQYKNGRTKLNILKSKRRNKNDIIPIQKTKRRPRKQAGGAISTQPGVKPSNVKQIEQSKKVAFEINLPEEEITKGNKEISFKKLARSKSLEYKTMFFKKKTPEGQFTMLEKYYYLLMAQSQSVYHHIKPTELFFSNLVGLFKKAGSAFTLHSTTGIQIANYDKLSTGTTLENYADIVYSLSMMRRNVRENFLEKCDKQFIRYIGGLAKRSGKGLAGGIGLLLKTSKALVKLASMGLKTKSGVNDIKKLFTEIFDSNSILPLNARFLRKHKDKKKFICTLFRYRRDQFRYNYYMDKFLKRMERIFKDPRMQSQYLEGMSPQLYNGDTSKTSRYSIRSIITTTPRTFLVRFKNVDELAYHEDSDYNNGLTPDMIVEELKTMIASLAKYLDMGNIHRKFTVIDNNDRVYYKYSVQDGKQTQVLKPQLTFNQTGGKPSLAPEAANLAYTYRVYHMLSHLYPKNADISTSQAELLQSYGLPLFDDMSYHKNKFKAKRKAKVFEQDYERFSRSINNISGTLDEYINLLQDSVDFAIQHDNSSGNTKPIAYRNIINWLKQMRNGIVTSTSQAQLNGLRDIIINSIIKLDDKGTELQFPGKTQFTFYPPAEIFSALDEDHKVTAFQDYLYMEIPGISQLTVTNLFDESISVERRYLTEYIDALIKLYQNKLMDTTGMTRKIHMSKDAKAKLFASIGLPDLEAEATRQVMAGGGNSISEESSSDEEWDGTDAHLDVLDMKARLKHMQTGGAGPLEGLYEIQKIPLDENGTETVSCMTLTHPGLSNIYTIIIDFLNNPQFINSGSKLSKIFHKFIPTALKDDSGGDKDVGTESMFMELNYFNYLLKFEMGVINFDDDHPDSNIPLGTNMSRVVSSIPLFYETYLINYFTDINTKEIINYTNHSCIGYELASPHINDVLKANGSVKVFDVNTQNGYDKSNTLSQQFHDASMADKDGKYHKIPLSLLELATMTPEELISLSSLASNAELAKFLGDNLALTLNSYLASSAKYLKPLITLLNDKYDAKSFYLGEYAVNSYEFMSSLVSTPTEFAKYPTLVAIYNMIANNTSIPEVDVYISNLKQITKFIKNAILSNRLWDANDKWYRKLGTVLLNFMGDSIVFFITGSGSVASPLTLILPWIDYNIYKYQTFEAVKNMFLEAIKDDTTKGLIGLSSFWTSLTKEEKAIIFEEAGKLFNVYRNVKYDYFFSSSFKEKEGYVDPGITTKSIMQNLIYLDLLEPITDVNISNDPDEIKTNKLDSQTNSLSLKLCSLITSVKTDLEKTTAGNVNEGGFSIFVAKFLYWYIQTRMKGDHATAIQGLMTLITADDTTISADPTGKTAEKLKALRNIFSDYGNDRYGLSIFSSLEGIADTNDIDGYIVIQQVDDPNNPVMPPFDEENGGFKHTFTNVGYDESNGDGVFVFNPNAYVRSSDLSTGKKIVKSVQKVLGKEVAFDEAHLLEIMKTVLGVQKYIDCLTIFAEKLDYVEESITRSANAVSRQFTDDSGVISSKKTIKSDLIKTGYSDFTALLLSGNFNGLYTNSIKMIGESGVINLIQYYRNLLMDIANTEVELQASTPDRDESRVKFNKVLTKMLVFLRLNSLFTDYVQMNKDMLGSGFAESGEMPDDDGLLAYLALPTNPPASSKPKPSSPAPPPSKSQPGLLYKFEIGSYTVDDTTKKITFTKPVTGDIGTLIPINAKQPIGRAGIIYVLSKTKVIYRGIVPTTEINLEADLDPGVYIRFNKAGPDLTADCSTFYAVNKLFQDATYNGDGMCTKPAVPPTKSIDTIDTYSNHDYKYTVEFNFSGAVAPAPPAPASPTTALPEYKPVTLYKLDYTEVKGTILTITVPRQLYNIFNVTDYNADTDLANGDVIYSNGDRISIRKVSINAGTVDTAKEIMFDKPLPEGLYIVIKKVCANQTQRLIFKKDDDSNFCGVDADGKPVNKAGLAVTDMNNANAKGYMYTNADESAYTGYTLILPSSSVVTPAPAPAPPAPAINYTNKVTLHKLDTEVIDSSSSPVKIVIKKTVYNSSGLITNNTSSKLAEGDIIYSDGSHKSVHQVKINSATITPATDPVIFKDDLPAGVYIVVFTMCSHINHHLVFNNSITGPAECKPGSGTKLVNSGGTELSEQELQSAIDKGYIYAGDNSKEYTLQLPELDNPPAPAPAPAETKAKTAQLVKLAEYNASGYELTPTDADLPTDLEILKYTSITALEAGALVEFNPATTGTFKKVNPAGGLLEEAYTTTQTDLSGLYVVKLYLTDICDIPLIKRLYKKCTGYTGNNKNNANLLLSKYTNNNAVFTITFGTGETVVPVINVEEEPVEETVEELREESVVHTTAGKLLKLADYNAEGKYNIPVREDEIASIHKQLINFEYSYTGTSLEISNGSLLLFEPNKADFYKLGNTDAKYTTTTSGLSGLYIFIDTAIGQDTKSGTICNIPIIIARIFKNCMAHGTYVGKNNKTSFAKLEKYSPTGIDFELTIENAKRKTNKGNTATQVVDAVQEESVTPVTGRRNELAVEERKNGPVEERRIEPEELKDNPVEAEPKPELLQVTPVEHVVTLPNTSGIVKPPIINNPAVREYIKSIRDTIPDLNLQYSTLPSINKDGKAPVTQVNLKDIINYQLDKLEAVTPDIYKEQVAGAYALLIGYITKTKPESRNKVATLADVFVELPNIFKNAGNIKNFTTLLSKLRLKFAKSSPAINVNDYYISQGNITALETAKVLENSAIPVDYQLTNREKRAFILAEAIYNYIILYVTVLDSSTIKSVEDFKKYAGILTVSKLGEIRKYMDLEDNISDLYILRGIDTALAEYCKVLGTYKCTSSREIDTTSMPGEYNPSKFIKLNIKNFSMSGGSRKTKKKQHKISSKKRLLKTYNKGRVSARRKSQKSGLGKSKKRARSA